MPAFHSPRENRTSKFACDSCRYCMFKEDPNMAAISRARAFQGPWHVQLLACIEKRAGVVSPCLLIEIHSEEPAGFVWKEGINANGFFPKEMILNHHVAQWEGFPCIPIDLLPILRPA